MDRVIKILFLAANPSDTPQLRLDEEIRAIDEALLKAEFRDRFDIKQHWAVRVTDLQACLLRHKPDIVHFSGHGSTSNAIVLKDNLGNSHPVSVRALSQLFSVLKDNIRCVVLNACYSEQQAKAIAEHIDCVIGMSRTIGDSSAISFARSFYRALGYGRDVKTAFDLGCVQIDLENLNEYNTPKLIAINANPEEVVFVCGLHGAERMYLQRFAPSHTETARSARPYSLPPLVVPFVNREKELERVKNTLRKGGVAILSGLGGIGKTALASQVIHELIDESSFPDGVVWLDLRGVSDTVEIINSIGRSFGFPVAEIVHPEDLVPYLSNKNALLVFDNADDVQQSSVSDILKARGKCAILITSRQRDLVQQGVMRQFLKPLPLEESVSLLTARLAIETKPDKLVLIEVCNVLGCLPLALELAAAYIAACDVSLSEFLAAFQERRLAGVEEIRSAFDLSYEKLNKIAQQVLKVIGLFGGDNFSLEATSAGIGMPESDLRIYLDELVAKSMIRRANQSTRYTIHPLLKEYVQDKTTSDERQMYMERLTTYFLDFSQRYGKPNNFQAWNTLEVEIRNILPVIDWCYDHSRIPIYFEFQQAVGHCLQVRGYTAATSKHTQQTIELVLANPENLELVWQLAHRILRLIYQQKYDIAFDVIRLVEPIFEKVQDIGGIAHIKRNLGEIAEHKDDLRTAKAFYEEALDLAYQLPDVTDDEIIFNNQKSRVAWNSWKLGRIVHQLGDYARAMKLLTTSLDLQRERKSPHGIGAVLCEFGHLERGRRNYQKAKEYYSQSIDLLEEIGYDLYTAEAKFGLGKVCIALGESTEGLMLVQDSLELFEKLGMGKESGEVRAFLNQSSSFSKHKCR